MGGDKTLKAAKVLKDLTGQEPLLNKCKYTIRSFGVRRGDKIATNVTVRGEKAKEILERGLKVKEYELNKNCFSNMGHFGMDFYVVLKRAGYRVSKKKRKGSRLGNSQKISRDEAREWFKAQYDGVLI